MFPDRVAKTARALRRHGLLALIAARCGRVLYERVASFGWARLGAIVPTAGTPFFFKLTGPARSVSAAGAEFDSLVGSLVAR